jgi:hypothetical protein
VLKGPSIQSAPLGVKTTLFGEHEKEAEDKYCDTNEGRNQKYYLSFLLISGHNAGLGGARYARAAEADPTLALR